MNDNIKIESNTIYFANEKTAVLLSLKNGKKRYKNIIPLIEKTSLSPYLVGKFFPKLAKNIHANFSKKHFQQISETASFTDIELSDVRGWTYDNSKEKFKFLKLYEIKKGFLIDSNCESVYVPLVFHALMASIHTLMMDKFNYNQKFIMSLTGGTSKIRTKLALLCCNIFIKNGILNPKTYQCFHVTPKDSVETVIKKAVLCKDSTLIAFDPTEEQYLALKKIYIDCNLKKMVKNSHNRSELQLCDKPFPNGNCLIVTKNKNNIPFKTLNVTIPSSYKEIPKEAIDMHYKNISKSTHDFFDLYLKDFIECIENNMETVFNDFQYSPNPTDMTKNIFNLILNILNSIYDEFNTEEMPRYKQIINNLFKQEFISKTILHEYEKGTHYDICRKIDSYFNYKNKRCLLHCNKPFHVEFTRAWYSKHFIYFLPQTLNDILRITMSKNITPTIIEQLKKSGLLYTNDDSTSMGTTKALVKINGMPENIQYYIFSRENCFHSFKNIESIINSRKDYSDKEAPAQASLNIPTPQTSKMEQLTNYYPPGTLLQSSDIKKFFDRYYISTYIKKAINDGYLIKEMVNGKKAYRTNNK